MVDAIAAVAATPTTAPTGLARPDPAGAAGDQDFSALLADGLQSVSDTERAADAVATDMATGGPSTIEDLMVATTQAQLSVEMLGVVRDKAIAAYQEIMRMPV